MLYCCVICVVVADGKKCYQEVELVRKFREAKNCSIFNDLDDILAEEISLKKIHLDFLYIHFLLNSNQLSHRRL